MHSSNAVCRILSGRCLPCADGIASKVQVLDLPALLQVIPGAVLHDTLLMVSWDVGRNQQVFQLDLACQNVNVFQQIFPFPLKAALKVCCFRLLALAAALQFLQLLPLLLYFFLSLRRVYYGYTYICLQSCMPNIWSHNSSRYK